MRRAELPSVNPMATGQHTGGDRRHDGGIDPQELVDCGPVSGLDDDQKEAARAGFEMFLTVYDERHPTGAIPDNPTTSAVVAALSVALRDDAGETVEVGEWRIDSDRDEEVIVVDVHEIPAEDYGVLTTQQTVAEHNPEHPADDRVIEAVYVGSVDNAEDVAQQVASGDLDAADLQTYTFPESRLTATEDGGSR